MLADPEMFERVEKRLLEDGTIKRFEEENGKILGRMMITLAEIPENIPVNRVGGKEPVAFEASFDFYETKVGLALYPVDKTVATGIWITEQSDGAEAPSEDWIEFFVKTLVNSIGDDGSYSYPIYSFVNNICDMTVIPTAPEQ